MNYKIKILIILTVLVSGCIETKTEIPKISPQVPNLTDEYLKTIIQKSLNLTDEQKTIIGIALSNQTVKDMVKEKEIKITSVNTVSYSNDDEGYILPGVQMYISSDNWTSARMITPLVDLKEKRVVNILSGPFVHQDMLKNLIS